jgi:GNAT superfamily N-acetyltransferase
MSRTGDPAPEDTWIGVVEDGQVIGAVHASPHYGQAANIVEMLGHPDAGSPGWLRLYVEQVASLEEIAVEPAHRRQGAGAALVRAVGTALTKRRARTIAGFATNAATIELFRSQRFTIGGYKQPVPQNVAAGLKTVWWDAAPDDGRYFWKVLPLPGSAFGVAASAVLAQS